MTGWAAAVAGAITGHRYCAARIRALEADLKHHRDLIGHLKRRIGELEAATVSAHVQRDRAMHLAYVTADAEAAARRRAEHAETRLHTLRIPLYDIPDLPEQRTDTEPSLPTVHQQGDTAS